MMNKFKRRMMLLPLLFSLSFSATSCSAFFNTASGQGIANVTTMKNQENGDTIITITFSDEDKDPVSFIIPQGMAGKDGISIKDVKSSMTEDNQNVNLEITFSDDSKTVLTIPVIQGKGIAKVDIQKDEDGNNVSFTFTYTDGSVGEKITIPKGKDGIGIKSFDVSEADEEGNILISVTFSDGTKSTFSIKNGKDGKDGESVYSIELNEEKSDDENYVLTITYTDGFTQDISLPRPKSTRWLTGINDPSEDASLADAKDGDFYLDQANGYVYQKTDGKWKFLFGMKGDSSSSKAYHVVSFFAIGAKISVTDKNGNETFFGESTYASVMEGKTLPLESIPLAKKDGYQFLGWYSSLDNVNAGKFTDMVPVYEDLKLYAKFEAI